MWVLNSFTLQYAIFDTKAKLLPGGTDSSVTSSRSYTVTHECICVSALWHKFVLCQFVSLWPFALPLSCTHPSTLSFTPQAKSEVAILINLPASFQLTSGQPHLKLHSLLLNQAGETEAEAGKPGKYEVGDRQTVGWRGRTLIMDDREGNKTRRETPTGNQKKGR